jgi:photosystem II stability/assembly factor-like uncharacterized protein
LKSPQRYRLLHSLGGISMGISLRTVFAVCLLVFTASVADGQEGRLLSPEGGDVRSMTADPRNPDNLYIGTVDGHVFGSTDGGTHWHLAGRVGNRQDLVVMAMMVDRRDARSVFAATRVFGDDGGGVYRSDDGGATWRASGLPGQTVRAIAQSESEPSMILAGTLDGVYRTRNDGRDWERMSPAKHEEMRNFDSLAIDPRNASVVYAGTYHLAWKTTDGGANWAPIHNGMAQDSDVMSITLDPTNPDRVYASACSGIYHSDNLGELWAKYRSLPDSDHRTQIIKQDPGNKSIVYAGTTSGLWKTANAGVSWARVTPANWTISAILMDSGRPGRVVLGVEGLGVYVSHDSAANIVSSNEGFSHRQVSDLVVDPNDPSHMLLAVTNSVQSFFESRDSGRDWKALGGGATSQNVRAIYAGPDGWWAAPRSGGLLHYDSQRGNWVNVGVETNAPQAPATVRKTAATQKNSTTALSSAAASKAMRAVVYDLSFSHQMWLAATSDGLLASRDRGATWTPFNSYRGAKAAVHVAKLSADGREMWVLSDAGLSISRDGGANWVSSQAGFDPKRITRMTVADEETLFAMQNGGAWISRDAGMTWRAVNLPDVQVEDLAVANNQWVVATRQHGLFVSSNGGRDWSSVAGSFGDGHFAVLAADASARRVLAASATDGLYSLSVPLATSSASVRDSRDNRK